jgi:hypothetical protein
MKVHLFLNFLLYSLRSTSQAAQHNTRLVLKSDRPAPEHPFG